MLNLPEQRQIIKQLLTPFPVVRFMNWQQINRLPHHARPVIKQWSDMLSADSDWDYKGGPWDSFRGVPLDIILDYANEMEVRPWLNIHHAATDEMIRTMVNHIIDRSDRRPILEYSNEIWNGMFVQRGYASEMGLALGLADKEWEAPLVYQAQRTKVIKDVAGDRADVVIGTQFFNPYLADLLLQETDGYVDALAVAPYLGRNQRAVDVLTGDIKTQDELLTELLAEVENEIAPLIAQYAEKAADYGAHLYAYEGGLHHTARNTGPDQFLAEREALAEFNRSSDAHLVTTALWQAWQRNGGGIACPYSLCTVYENKHNGHLESTYFGHTELYGNEIRVWEKYLATLEVLAY